VFHLEIADNGRQDVKIKPFLVISCILLLCLATFHGRAGAGEPEIHKGQRTASIDEQSELLLLYGEKALVTATKHSTPLRKAPAIATIITADEIRNMGARNLLDVLKMVPGFGISINVYGINMIEVRGLRNIVTNKILFMIDGHSMQNNIYGSALYELTDSLPVENIKQVEVVRGPGSALYGNSAFVATINVITRDPDEINGLEVKTGGGSFDTYKGNLVGAITNAKLAASGSFDYYETDGPKLLVESDAISDTPWSMAPGYTDMSIRQTDTFLKILYGDLSFRGHYLNSSKAAYIGFNHALTDDNLNNQEYFWNELTYHLNLSKLLSLDIKLFYDYYHKDHRINLLPDGFGGSFTQGMIGNPIVSDRTFGGEIQVDWAPFKGHQMIAGVAYEEMKQYGVKHLANFDPSTGADIGPIQEVTPNWNKDATRQIWAIYLQDEWQALERLNLTVGVRYDNYSDFGETINPRAGLVWNLIDNTDFKLLYGQAFRAPTFQELYDLNPVSIGNPALQPERIQTFEAGITYRFSRALSMDLNYFYSAIDDLIMRESEVVPAFFANIGKWITQGVEFGLSGKVFTTLQWNATYTWQDPIDDITGDRLPYVPSHRVTASLNYGLTRHLNLHSDLIWTGSRPRDRGETRSDMPDYVIVDLAVTAWGFFRTMEIQLAVHNLFDKRYYDPDTSGAANNIPGDYPREGISATIDVTYKF
jgi:iron complex outermembrane receptor protein